MFTYYYSTNKNMPNYGIGHKNQSLNIQFQCIKFNKGKLILFCSLCRLQNQNSKLSSFFDSWCLSLNKSITTLNFAGTKQLASDNLHNVLLGNHSKCLMKQTVQPEACLEEFKISLKFKPPLVLPQVR